VSTVTRYVSESIDAYYTSDSTGDASFTGELNAAALRVHADVLEARESGQGKRSMSTTLTLLIFVWPYVYALQVGDSRYYQLRGDNLLQVTRDQTIGQQLVDSGVLKEKEAVGSKWAGVLASTIGGSESEPVVTRVDSDWGYVHLICSDGLTKHVSDERIREHLMSMTSAKQVCEDLLQEALDGGGSDNISLIVVRPLRKDA
jgi:protein phosphatase